LLWKANLYGAFVGDYETAYSTDPFDDSIQPSGKNAAFRPQMLTYPVQDGLISTVQWEAIREGVTDVRYLTTYFAALRECKDNHVAGDLVKSSAADVAAFLAKPLDQLSDADLQAGRFMIATYAAKLRGILDAYYVTHPLYGAAPPVKSHEIRGRAVWGP